MTDPVSNLQAPSTSKCDKCGSNVIRTTHGGGVCVSCKCMACGVEWEVNTSRGFFPESPLPTSGGPVLTREAVLIHVRRALADTIADDIERTVNAWHERRKAVEAELARFKGYLAGRDAEVERCHYQIDAMRPVVDAVLAMKHEQLSPDRIVAVLAAVEAYERETDPND